MGDICSLVCFMISLVVRLVQVQLLLLRVFLRCQLLVYSVDIICTKLSLVHLSVSWNVSLVYPWSGSSYLPFYMWYSFIILCAVGLDSINFLSLCLSWNVLSPSILRWLLDVTIFLSAPTWSTSFHAFLVFSVYDVKTDVILEVYIIHMSWYSLSAFNSISWLCIFETLSVMCHEKVLLCPCLFGVLHSSYIVRAISLQVSMTASWIGWLYL